MMRLFKLAFLALLVLLPLLCPPSATAGGKPSESKCASLGFLDVECRVRYTGEFLGKVSVPAQYSAKYNSCFDNFELARDRCALVYGQDIKKTCAKTKYRLGVSRYENWFPKDCQF